MTVAHEAKFTIPTKTGRKLQFVIIVELFSVQVQYLGCSDHASGLLNIPGVFDATDLEDFLNGCKAAVHYGKHAQEEFRARARKDLEESAEEHAHITAELDAPAQTKTFRCVRCGQIFNHLHSSDPSYEGHYICTGCCDE